jgi:hypothetical protein
VKRGDRLDQLDQQSEAGQAEQDAERRGARPSGADEAGEHREGEHMLDLVGRRAGQLRRLRQHRHDEREGGGGPEGEAEQAGHWVRA